MKRFYSQLVREHFKDLRQMVFLAGPRQVGKTTISLEVGKQLGLFYYFNWDHDASRASIIAGTLEIAELTGLLKISNKKPVIIFDEIHKFGRWKQFLKGFFDVYGERCHILVTGSAKLNIYKKTGDSLMGRYFLYRIHPLSIRELLTSKISSELIAEPKPISTKRFDQLVQYGGFPEPYLRSTIKFSSKWHRTTQSLLLREDIRDLCQIQELAQLETLSTLLQETVGQYVTQSTLANHVKVSIPTISRWLETLEAFYYCFSIRPWSKNVKRSLRKEPKYYLWDWSRTKNKGALLENFVASHLLKAAHFWTDYGFGNFELFYLRDKEKREVDFLMTKDQSPWFLVEVKSGDNGGISKSLYHFQEQTGAMHAFQLNFGLKYVDQNCFAYTKPIIVPASTFLSQLV